MKSIILFLLATVLAPGMTAKETVTINTASDRAEEVTSIAEYIPMTVENLNGFRGDDFNGFRDVDVGAYITGANPNFWAENRSHGTPYPILRTFVDEPRMGAFRTRLIWLKQGTYVSFLIGGNPHLDGEGKPASFVNIFNQDDEYDAAQLYNHAFNDPNCSENMIFKYFQIPADGNYLFYIRDGAEGGFGGVNFGELRINQTFDELCKSFSAHKAYYRSACFSAETAIAKANTDAYNYMMVAYSADEYKPLNDRIAELTSGNEGFERSNGMLGWTIDRDRVLNSGNAVVTNVNGVISTAETKQDGHFDVAMPFNKTGTGFFNGEDTCTGLGEGEAYRFISHEFKLNSDLVSVKLGGGTAVFDVIDATTHEILATTNDGDNHPNPVFNKGIDGEESLHGRNISKTGSRLNTMSRVYLDVSAHKGKQVRLAISDNRTGGDWGLAYFDEIVTDYATAPSYVLDTFEQIVNEETKYYGVAVPKYVGGTETAFGEAYTFLDTYYSLMRANGGTSYCSETKSQTTTRTNIIDAYNALSSEARAIVDASEDYDHGESDVATPENYWLHEVRKGTVGASMAYTMNYVVNTSFISLFKGGIFATKEGSGVGIMIIGLCLTLSLIAFLIIKKRKHN